MFKNLILSAAALGVLLACQPPPAAGGSGSKELVDRLEKRGAAGGKQRREKAPQTAAYTIDTKDSPTMGAKDAKVSVVVFSDYQCPFCSRVDPMLHDVLKDPELKDKVNVVFKHFPLSFHKDARPASKAAMAAAEQGEENFWKMSEKLYANQRALKSENFSKWAGEIGLDVAKFESDLKANDAKYEEQIKADMKVGQSQARVRGTPSLFVNGWELRQRSVQGVKDLIKEKKLN